MKPRFRNTPCFIVEFQGVSMGGNLQHQTPYHTMLYALLYTTLYTVLYIYAIYYLSY